MIEDESAAMVPTSDDLIRIDDQLAEQGVPVFNRPFEAAKLWGIVCGSEWEIALAREGWFKDAYKELHPSIDFTADSFLTLCVSARGISYFVKPPKGYGRCAIKPIDHVSISNNEISRLWNDHPESFWELQWQGFDAIDLFMAMLNFHPKLPSASNMMRTAVSQLTASARQLVACELDSSLPQGMSMSCELAGKAILIAQGFSAQRLRSIGHNLETIHNEVSAILPSPVDHDVTKAINQIPAYVKVRYEAPLLNLLEAQNLYSRAMFVIADFLRRTNHSQGYWDVSAGGKIPARKI